MNLEFISISILMSSLVLRDQCLWTFFQSRKLFYFCLEEPNLFIPIMFMAPGGWFPNSFGEPLILHLIDNNLCSAFIQSTLFPHIQPFTHSHRWQQVIGGSASCPRTSSTRGQGEPGIKPVTLWWATQPFQIQISSGDPLAFPLYASKIIKRAWLRQNLTRKFVLARG